MARNTIVIIVVLALLTPVSITGLGVAQPPSSHLTENEFEQWYDFESGSPPQDWSSTSTIYETSFEDTYSMGGFGMYDNPNAIANDTGQIYLRYKIGNTNFNQQEIIEYDDGTLFVIHQNQNTIEISTDDTTGSVTIMNTKTDVWQDMYIDINSSTIDVWVWDSSNQSIGDRRVSFNHDGIGDTTDDNVIIANDNEFRLDEIGWGVPFDGTMHGVVTDQNDYPLSNVSVNITAQDTEIDSLVETNENGEYSRSMPNGMYNATAKKPGYINHTRTNITVDGSTQVDFELINRSEAFEFDIQRWMEHGTTQEWDATWINQSGRTDISDDITVISNNTTVVTTDNSTNQLIATDNVSVNQQTHVTATYNNNSFQENVTVANRTIDHISEMPPEQWVPTVLGFGEDQAQYGIGSEIQWVLLAIGIGATAAWSAKNEWMGVGIIIGGMILFWVLGYVGFPLMLVSVFYGLMAGYQLQETPSRSDTDVGGGLNDPFQ